MAAVECLSDAKGIVEYRLCMYAKHVCMYVCMYAKHVCMDAKHVCMFTERVCMFGENRAPKDEVRFLTKTFSIRRFNSIF